MSLLSETVCELGSLNQPCPVDLSASGVVVVSDGGQLGLASSDWPIQPWMMPWQHQEAEITVIVLRSRVALWPCRYP